MITSTFPSRVSPVGRPEQRPPQSDAAAGVHVDRIGKALTGHQAGGSTLSPCHSNVTEMPTFESGLHQWSCNWFALTAINSRSSKCDWNVHQRENGTYLRREPSIWAP